MTATPPSEQSWRPGCVRGEPMVRCCVYLLRESAYAVLTSLGESGLMQFDDMNADVATIQKKYNAEIQLCTDLLAIVRRVQKEAAIIQPRETRDQTSAVDLCAQACSISELRTTQVYLGDTAAKLTNYCLHIDVLSKDIDTLREHEAVLRTTSALLAEVNDLTQASVVSAAADIEMAGMDSESIQVNFLNGTIPQQKVAAFELMLWRACRGNVYVAHREILEDLLDQATGQALRKVAFVLLMQGTKLKLKARRICDGFKVKLYPAPKTERERQILLADVTLQIGELRQVLDKTIQHKNALVRDALPGVSTLAVRLRKCQAVFCILNSFEYNRFQTSLRCAAWYPLYAAQQIQAAITSAAVKYGRGETPCVITHERLAPYAKPPTLNRVNKVTKSFQGLVDSYGINAYQEVNPAPFSTITFPFLFAVMFGDFGHGLLLTAFALAMVVGEKTVERKKDLGEIFKTLFRGRYLMLLMGLFSTYTGLVYNEALSKPLAVFATQWKVTNATYQMSVQSDGSSIQLDPQSASAGHTYPFGLDPVWSIADNRISFSNSYKMKLSVVIGVTQMVFGIFLSILNFAHYREYFSLFSEFLPEIIFISCIFGYLTVLIIAKWTWHFDNTSCAPSLLIGFIRMFLMEDPANSETAARGCKPFLYSSYSQQRQIEEGLVFASLLCIPWLLLVKPLYLCITGRERMTVAAVAMAAAATGASTERANVGATETPPTAQQQPRADDAAAGLSEVFMHQAIHTIEYCLGCVSHTASYLRLWALSLAHVELSEVLWDMVLRNGLKVPGYAGGAAIFAVFPVFAVLTVAILLLMEGLSAFLHTLRLHWVEFQSKFYKGDGIKFSPFDLKMAAKAGP